MSYLRLAVEVASGQPAAHFANTRTPSKFAGFVAECFKLSRVPMPDADCDYLELAVWIINDLEKERQRNAAKMAWRDAVSPLEKLAPITPACKLIEHGMAEVLRVEAGNPNYFPPAALIEYPDVGTLCFLVDGEAFTVRCGTTTGRGS